jgi:tRNA (cytidine/uridine-2'-O-)-methyltransferase
MDYIEHVDLLRHDSWEAFLAAKPARSRLVLLTTKGASPLHSFAFHAHDILLFGRESAGVPEEIHTIADGRVVIPLAPNTRSLNVGVAAAIVTAEALRQTQGAIT